jgi:hypothetical protein
MATGLASKCSMFRAQVRDWMGLMCSGCYRTCDNIQLDCMSSCMRARVAVLCNADHWADVAADGRSAIHCADDWRHGVHATGAHLLPFWRNTMAAPALAFVDLRTARRLSGC